MTKKTTKLNALLAVGGNIPFEGKHPPETIQAVADSLFLNGIQLVDSSKIYHTPCFPVGAGPDFANAVFRVEFDGTVEALLETCHKLEKDFGRVRNARWSARTLDVDVLAVGDQIWPSNARVRHWMSLPPEEQSKTAPDELLIPHPRMHERSFVLVPMVEIAPDWRHPILGKTVKELLESLSKAEKQQIRPICAVVVGN